MPVPEELFSVGYELENLSISTDGIVHKSNDPTTLLKPLNFEYTEQWLNQVRF